MHRKCNIDVTSSACHLRVRSTAGRGKTELTVACRWFCCLNNHILPQRIMKIHFLWPITVRKNPISRAFAVFKFSKLMSLYWTNFLWLNRCLLSLWSLSKCSVALTMAWLPFLTVFQKSSIEVLVFKHLSDWPNNQCCWPSILLDVHRWISIL